MGKKNNDMQTWGSANHPLQNMKAFANYGGPKGYVPCATFRAKAIIDKIQAKIHKDNKHLTIEQH